MKIRFGLVLALALGLGTVGCAAGGGTSSESATPARPASTPGGSGVAQGERPRQTENTRTAQKALEDAEDAADDTQKRTLLGQALTAAQAAIAEDPTNPLAHRQSALINLALENYVDAGLAFDEASRLRPLYEFEDAGIRERAWIDLYQEALPLVSSADYAAAAVVFENANAIYSVRPEVMITLGQIYAQLREHDKALAQLDKAIEIINSDKAAEMDSATVAEWKEQALVIPTTRAQILADAGRFDEAAAVFRAIVAADPSDILSARNLAGILVQQDKTEEAFVVYDQLMMRPELTAADFYTIGVGFYQGSDYERSVRAFSKSVEMNPKDRDGVEMWARSLQIDSVYSAIPAVAQRWIDLDPNNQNAYLIYAQAANQNEDQDAARTMVANIEALEVLVDNLQISRLPDGGANVSGAVTNKSLAVGANVTLTFTFYDNRGSAIGTATQRVTVAAPGMAELFQTQFSSATTVGGYGYTLAIG